MCSDNPEVRSSCRLLMPGSNSPETQSLRDPRFSVSSGRETIGFLDKLAQPRNAHFVKARAILEYLICRVTHDLFLLLVTKGVERPSPPSQG
jgi:hypothetical protein